MSVRLRVPAVEDPDFTADLTDGEPAELRLTGSADSAASAPLAELLTALHAELQAKRTRVIVVDMLALDAMSSVCFKQLLGWLSTLQELAPEDRYRIRIRSNPAILWQKHGLRALSCFDTTLIEIEAG
jgi:hypothetical protein